MEDATTTQDAGTSLGMLTGAASQVPAAETAAQSPQEQAQEAKGLATVQDFIDKHVHPKADKAEAAKEAKPKADKEAKADKAKTPGKAKDKAEAEAAPKSEKPKPEAKAAFTPSEAQLQAAKHVGYSDDEIEEMGEAEFSAAERASKRLRRQESRLGREAQGKEKTPAQPQAEGQEPPKAEPKSPDAAHPLRFLEEDSYETVISKNNTLAERLERLEADIAADRERREQAEQESTRKQVAKEVDEWFGKLEAEDYPQLKDGYQTPEGKRLLIFARGLMDAHEAAGEDVSTADCLDEALAIVAKEQHHKAIARKAIGEALESRRNAKVSGQAPPVRAIDEDEQGREKLRQRAAEMGRAMK